MPSFWQLGAVSSVCSGGWRWLRVVGRAATSATCSSSCCLISVVLCLVRARGKVNNSSKRQQNLLNYYLPLLPYLTFVRRQRGRLQVCQPAACNPLPKTLPSAQSVRNQHKKVRYKILDNFAMIIMTRCQDVR